jgi:glutamate synthase domain-containing protein 3
MAQAGRLVICGDAGVGLGDSLYEAVIYVGGKIQSLGADAREETMTETDYREVEALLQRAGMRADVKGFKRVGSARTMYHWNADAHHKY